MSLNAFVKEEVLRGTTWQFVGDTVSSRVITVRAGYSIEGKWTYMPPIEVRTREGQTQKDRFIEWVERFVGLAKEDDKQDA